MADGPARLDWPAVAAGDYFDAWQMTVRLKATQAPIALTRAAMQVRRADGSLLLDWATDLPASAPGYGCMVLIDGAAGRFQVGPANMPDVPGVHYHEIELLLADGRRKSWAAGAFEILPQGAR